jgi:hypothetical protein
MMIDVDNVMFVFAYDLSGPVACIAASDYGAEETEQSLA